jgi:uncharacterized protein
MAQPPLVVNAVELLREPGARASVRQTIEPAEIDAGHEAITGPLAVDAVLESTLDDVVVTGHVDVPWRGTCRRCLAPLEQTLRVPLEERYGDSPELIASGEVVPIERAQIDLRGLVRDEVLLAAAEERLCREDCAGLCPTCGADLNRESCECAPPPADPRWGVLDQLRERELPGP